MFSFGQFDLLSALLRRFPEKRFKAFDENNNLYSTTIFVLTSAIQKVARSAKIVEGTPFYRGLGGGDGAPRCLLEGRRSGPSWICRMGIHEHNEQQIHCTALFWGKGRQAPAHGDGDGGVECGQGSVYPSLFAISPGAYFAVFYGVL